MALTDIVGYGGVNLTARGDVGTLTDIVKETGGLTLERGNVGTLTDIVNGSSGKGGLTMARGNIGTLIDVAMDRFVMLTQAAIVSLGYSFGIIIG